MKSKKKNATEDRSDPYLPIWGPDLEHETLILFRIGKTPTRGAVLRDAYVQASIILACSGGWPADDEETWGRGTQLGARLWRSAAADLVTAGLLIRHGDGWMTKLARRELARRSKATGGGDADESEPGDPPRSADSRATQGQAIRESLASNAPPAADSRATRPRVTRENSQNRKENSAASSSSSRPPSLSSPSPPSHSGPVHSTPHRAATPLLHIKRGDPAFDPWISRMREKGAGDLADRALKLGKISVEGSRWPNDNSPLPYVEADPPSGEVSA